MSSGAAPVADKWTFNVFRVRYRNSFDGLNDYNAPEIANGVDYTIDAHSAVSLMFERDWSNGKASYTGIEIGYRYRF